MTILFINIKHSSYRFYAFWCMQSRDFEMVNLKYFYIELIFSQLHSQSTYSKVSNHSLIFSIHILWSRCYSTGKLCAELLKYRARVDVCDSISGDSALHKAVAANMVENVRILLQGGASPNSADNQGNTPMHKAARNCTDLEIWHLLVRCGGKLDTINVNKETPLTVAQEAKNSPVMLLYWPTQAEI